MRLEKPARDAVRDIVGAHDQTSHDPFQEYRDAAYGPAALQALRAQRRGGDPLNATEPAPRQANASYASTDNASQPIPTEVMASVLMPSELIVASAALTETQEQNPHQAQGRGIFS